MELHQVFKNCLSAAAITYRIKFSEFIRCRSIGDFLLDEASKASTPKELAASALAELCIGDTGQMDRAVCSSVVQFLDRELGAPCEDQAQMQRLVGMLRMTEGPEPANREQYLKWANSWYS